MADCSDCADCFDPERGVIRSSLIPSRSEALSLYIRLQGQGFLPAMCQNSAGTYRVCYAEKDRIGK